MATNEASGRFVPLSIVEALKEVARSPEDPCCRVALDTLTHFTLRNPEISASAGVLPIIVEAIIQPHMKALQDGLIMVVLYLLDSADTRVLFSNLSCTQHANFACCSSNWPPDFCSFPLQISLLP